MKKNNLHHFILSFFVSFRTERSGVKNLGNIMVDVCVDVPEILRFALNDKTDATYFLRVTNYKKNSVRLCELCGEKKETR